MATLTWPSTVSNKPKRDSFSEQAGTTVISSAVEVGPAKKRRRTTAETDRLSMVIPMSDAELSDFITFHDSTTKLGALRFDFTHPRTGNTIEARFNSEPSWEELVPGYWDVSIELEVLP